MLEVACILQLAQLFRDCDAYLHIVTTYLAKIAIKKDLQEDTEVKKPKRQLNRLNPEGCQLKEKYRP